MLIVRRFLPVITLIFFFGCSQKDMTLRSDIVSSTNQILETIQNDALNSISGNSDHLTCEGSLPQITAIINYYLEQNASLTDGERQLIDNMVKLKTACEKQKLYFDGGSEEEFNTAVDDFYKYREIVSNIVNDFPKQ